ncbi:MAG: hypothetical protein MJY69_04890 [Bacteroidales bacterium]|nr:hypothetical protein [Bacteroidales bacterium]
MSQRSLLILALLLVGCTPKTFTEKAEYPPIFPDYTGVTIPDGIAPINFELENGEKFVVEKKICSDTIWYKVKSWKKGERTGTSYKAFPIYISHDPIDPYIAYRLIEPGYESWHNMGIYQRELSSFREKAIVTNRVNSLGCVNCHSFCNRNADRMLFHARGKGGGTVIVKNGEASLTDLSKTEAAMQGTYPAWHPGGRYVAFSSNTTQQCFSINHEQPIEVYDTASDIMILDTDTGRTFTSPFLKTEDKLETFPGWSEDGKTLYYCRADNIRDVCSGRGDIHYLLEAIDFEDGEFRGEPRIIYGSDSSSVSFPRVCGRYLMFTESGFGTFPIWHKEADLKLLDTESGRLLPTEIINSGDTESYHSWSGNGKWVIFSSRRDDGRYTRLYIAHFDGNGVFGKPFMLPQRRPSHNRIRLKSYNIPEFVSSPVDIRQSEFKKLFQK